MSLNNSSTDSENESEENNFSVQSSSPNQTSERPSKEQDMGERILKEEIPDKGTIKNFKNIEFSYFDQKRSDLFLKETIKKNMCPSGGDYINVMGKDRHVYGYLKEFQFDPKILNDYVSTLSGGQKNRLMLAKILANPKSCLILDEPTNDLDMDTLDLLEEILINYKGTLIIVSHDRDFLDQTVTRILAFQGDGKVIDCIGAVSYTHLTLPTKA